MVFSDHIPPEILTTPSVKRFLDVLDELQLEKSYIVDEFSRSFNVLTTHSNQLLTKRIVDLGGLALVPGIPRKVLESFILDSHNIYDLKGTEKGLRLFLEIIGCGGVIIDHTDLINSGNFIIPDDLNKGYLMLMNEGVDAPSEAITDTEYQFYKDFINLGTGDFLFIFGDESYDAGIGRIEIRMVSPYAHIKEFRDWLGSIIIDFLPMAAEDSTDIKIILYSHVTIGSPYYYVEIP